MNKNNIKMMSWKGMTLVCVSDVKGFGEWLSGQTMPLVDDDAEPTNWAYYHDYLRYVQGLPCID